MEQIPVVPGSFLAINREERFFCSLLAHALLSSPYVRQQFYGRVQAACGVSLDPQPNATEVYSEVAWLRDHWRNLGDPRHWTQELEKNRIVFLAACLSALGRRVEDVEQAPFFRTKGKTPKVVTPGRWPLAGLANDRELELLRWAFNAKPDFLLICGHHAVIIEAKVESSPGKTSAGYSQDEVQETLCHLIPAVTPYLESVSRLWLAPAQIAASHAKTIPWATVADMAATTPAGELDEFTRDGLERFARRAETGQMSTG